MRYSWPIFLSLSLLSACSLTATIDESDVPDCLTEANGNRSVADRFCSNAYAGNQENYYDGCITHRCVEQGDGNHRCEAASETCDGADNDCDRLIDEATHGPTTTLSGAEGLQRPTQSGSSLFYQNDSSANIATINEMGMLTTSPLARKTTARAPAGSLPKTLIDGCHSGVGANDLVDAEQCGADELTAAQASDGRHFIAGVGSFGCAAGQLHVGLVDGNEWSEAGPTQRSNTFAGVATAFKNQALNARVALGSCSAIDGQTCRDALVALGGGAGAAGDACSTDSQCNGGICHCGQCLSNARSDFANQCGIGQLSMASINSGTTPEALLVGVGGSVTDNHCGETMRQVGFSLLNLERSGDLSLIQASNEGEFMPLGQTRSTTAPAVMAWSDRGYLVGHGNGEGQLSLHFVRKHEISASGLGDPNLCSTRPEACCTETGCRNLLACDTAIIAAGPRVPGSVGCDACQESLGLQACSGGGCPDGSTLCCGNRAGSFGSATPCEQIVYACGQPSETTMRQCVATESSPAQAITSLDAIDLDGDLVDEIKLAYGLLRGDQRDQLEVGVVWSAVSFQGASKSASSVFFKRLRLRVNAAGGISELVEASPSIRLSAEGIVATDVQVMYRSGVFRQNPSTQSSDEMIPSDQLGGWYAVWREQNDGQNESFLARIGEKDASMLGERVALGQSDWHRLAIEDEGVFLLAQNDNETRAVRLQCGR